MQLVYAQEPFPNKVFKSIFLAGPTPRSQGILSWRPMAIQFLKAKGFDGTIFIPEPRDGNFGGEYDEQGQWNWEIKCLDAADCILFWIPRDLETLPGFTTNVEWGRWSPSGKCVLGAPPNAEKMGYIKNNAKYFGVPFFSTLQETIDSALKFIGDGIWREDGESYVPLYIWRTLQFQWWYQSLKLTGDKLLQVGIQSVERMGTGDSRVVFIILRTKIFVKATNKFKFSAHALINSDTISTACLNPERITFESTIA